MPRIVHSDPPGVPAPPPGAFSHAVRVNGDSGALLYVSGQIAIDDRGALVGKGDVGKQSEQVFDILGKILAAHGAGFDDVVNIRTFLTDMDQLPGYLAVRKQHLTGPPPSSTTVEVSRLFNPDALLEVDLVVSLPA